MMSFSTWFAFFLLMTAIAYTPGPMTMFSMSSSVRNGFYRTLPAIAGGSFAYLTQMAVVYLGLGVIVQKSMLVFNTIKWAGMSSEKYYDALSGGNDLTKTWVKNITASVRQRLLNKSRSDARPFQELVQYYAME